MSLLGSTAAKRAVKLWLCRSCDVWLISFSLKLHDRVKSDEHNGKIDGTSVAWRDTLWYRWSARWFCRLGHLFGKDARQMSFLLHGYVHRVRLLNAHSQV
jgi:hypothetical protein